jgi:glycosyltransferase involved in cell wall biosynthesis
MAIYIDISAAVHGRAGLGRYAESLAQALVQEHPERFAFFYNRDRETSPLVGLESMPTRTVRAGYKPWRMAVWLGQLLGLGFERLVPEAELYHATEHLLLPLRRVPTVLTVHDLIYHLFPEYHKPLNYWFLNGAMPLFAQRTRAIIAVSESTKQDLIRCYGIPQDKIAVVHEAAAPHFRPASPEAIAAVRARYGLPEGFILTVGTIEPRKNLSRLLDALQRLRQQKGDDARLVVVGSKGWLYEGFFRRLEELQLGDAVLLPGYIPDADLPAIYSAARVFVLPSLYEGFGLSVLEAMACGTAVVCSRTSSLPEVGGDAAHYFDPTDVEEMAEAIGAVWHDETLQGAMSRRGLAQVARFSWARAAEETMAVYQQAMSL